MYLYRWSIEPRGFIFPRYRVYVTEGSYLDGRVRILFSGEVSGRRNKAMAKVRQVIRRDRMLEDNWLAGEEGGNYIVSNGVMIDPPLDVGGKWD